MVRLCQVGALLYTNLSRKIGRYVPVPNLRLGSTWIMTPWAFSVGCIPWLDDSVIPATCQEIFQGPQNTATILLWNILNQNIEQCPLVYTSTYKMITGSGLPLQPSMCVQDYFLGLNVPKAFVWRGTLLRGTFHIDHCSSKWFQIIQYSFLKYILLCLFIFLELLVFLKLFFGTFETFLDLFGIFGWDIVWNFFFFWFVFLWTFWNFLSVLD